MNKVRITAMRQTVYPDLMTRYENPIDHACEVMEGQQWISTEMKKSLTLTPEKQNQSNLDDQPTDNC